VQRRSEGEAAVGRRGPGSALKPPAKGLRGGGGAHGDGDGGEGGYVVRPACAEVLCCEVRALSCAAVRGAAAPAAAELGGAPPPAQAQVCGVSYRS
jgi:hypothetical protein